MTIYGDLDVSVIDELPPGRKPIQTLHKFDTQLTSLYQSIRRQINLGRQVYIVFPLIKESEKSDLKNLEEGYETLKQAFPEFKLSKIHGKMKSAEKEVEMEQFVKGKTQILVATTVIEVGVNVPNASVMVILDAQRFGLSQLHQLRGRVGRGCDQSYCILVTNYKLSEETRKRIDIMCDTNDGFRIAEDRLETPWSRRPGGNAAERHGFRPEDSEYCQRWSAGTTGTHRSTGNHRQRSRMQCSSQRPALEPPQGIEENPYQLGSHQLKQQARAVPAIRKQG